jgi:hypothetical protein
VGDEPIDAGQRMDPLELEPVTGDLPAGFETLRAEALAEGFRQIERLAAEWASRTTRFDREGEALLAARLNGVLAGIGGLTIEPVVPGALRMRRFYVRPRFGVGRKLAMALLKLTQQTGRLITVNAATGSVLFWEALGFKPDMREGHTHVLNPEGR